MYDGKPIPTRAGYVWLLLRGIMRRPDPDGDPDQAELFDLPPVRRTRMSRAMHLERAVVHIVEHKWRLIVGDFKRDVALDRWGSGEGPTVRVASRALPDLWETAIYMRKTIDAGDLDWRHNELTPEAFYAA